MSLEDVLLKLGSVEGIEAGDMEALTNLIKNPKGDGSDKERELKEAKAAQSRILQEKKALQQKTQEYEEQLEALKSGSLTEVEKTKKELDKIAKAKESLEKELLDTKSSYMKMQRDYKLERIGSKVKFLDTIPEDIQKFSISNAFNKVEDLDDEGEVSKVLASFTESYKGIIASESAARGSGDKGSSNTNTNVKSVDKMSVEERAAHLRKIRSGNKI